MSLPTPRLSTRGTAGYSFAELYLTRGPQAIGVTGNNSLSTLIGRTWALVLGVDGRLRLFQRAEAAATWTEQTEALPPLFDEVHPESRRRFSIAFDQSARATVAYEEDETIYVTRWDSLAGAYVQNVTIAGVDPVLMFDATWAYFVPDSDVLLFYLDAATRSKLLCRVQRDIYGTPYEMHDFGEPAVFDRVSRLPLRYQALASDEAGDPFENESGRVGLTSGLYPYRAEEPMVASFDVGGAELRLITRETSIVLASGAPANADYINQRVYMTVQAGEAELAGETLILDGLYTGTRLYLEVHVGEAALAGDVEILAGEYEETRAFHAGGPWQDGLDAEGSIIDALYEEV